jgi:cysteine desulfurase
MPTPVYLDYNATAPLRPAAREALLTALDTLGNPSSPHAFGRKTRALVEQARERIAQITKAPAGGVIFTASATEANNLALKGLPAAARAVAAVEHPSVLAAAPDAARLPVDGNGRLDLAALASWLAAAPAPPLVALQAANNETGVLQPLAEAAQLVHAHGGWLHVDAVQAAGRLAAQAWAPHADSLSLSAHKLGGPQGIGALVLRRDTPLAAQLAGGGQERRRRAGTEGVALIAGFSAALGEVTADRQSEAARLGALQRLVELGLSALGPAVTIFGGAAERLPNTTCFALAGTRAETFLIALDLEGVAVSSGAACSSGKVETSHVLAAMGVAPEAAAAALRVSTGWASRSEHIDAFLAAAAAHLRRLGRAA